VRRMKRIDQLKDQVVEGKIILNTDIRGHAVE
jgi:hypothetical protein